MTAPIGATALDPAQASASAIIQAQLDSWGLGTLTDTVNNLIRQGYGSDAITLQLQQTDAYKARFAGNAQRIKNGLAALSPADYIAAENSYRQVLNQHGIPAGIFDSQSDLDTFIANDVSPAELNDRAKTAQQVWLGTDQGTKDIWSQWYGLSDGAAIASILDPEKSLPQIQSMATAAQAGAAAKADGLQADQGRITSLVDQGYTLSQLQTGFTKIGQDQPATAAMAQRFGGPAFTQADAEAATIQGNSVQLNRQRQLYDSEQALFAGRSSADQNTNNTSQSGSF